MQATLWSLVDMSDPKRVFDEITAIMGITFPGYDSRLIERVFADVSRLFAGQYPGYRKCNTAYHDLGHTTDASLAMVRLIHGTVRGGEVLSEKNATLGLVCALLHDAGYIQTVNDTEGTGAKYTMNHIERSARFAEGYFGEIGLSEQDHSNCESILRCTGLSVKIKEITFGSRQIELLGQMMGTADLLGQMADERYVEKLPILYSEFQEGRVPGFSSEYDLLKSTSGFFEMVKKRCAQEFGNVSRYMVLHFSARWGIERDLYEEAITGNILKLRELLKTFETVR